MPSGRLQRAVHVLRGARCAGRGAVERAGCDPERDVGSGGSGVSPCLKPKTSKPQNPGSRIMKHRTPHSKPQTPNPKPQTSGFKPEWWPEGDTGHVRSACPHFEEYQFWRGPGTRRSLCWARTSMRTAEIWADLHPTALGDASGPSPTSSATCTTCPA